jgi:DNA-binding IclR family transcriptional regulator
MEFTKYTDRTLCDKKSILESLEKAKYSGYAEESEELEIGLSCVAAPIYNHFNNPFAAISLSGPTFRMNESFRKEISSTLKQFTQEISRKLGYSESL